MYKTMAFYEFFYYYSSNSRLGNFNYMLDSGQLMCVACRCNILGLNLAYSTTVACPHPIPL